MDCCMVKTGARESMLRAEGKSLERSCVREGATAIDTSAAAWTSTGAGWKFNEWIRTSVSRFHVLYQHGAVLVLGSHRCDQPIGLIQPLLLRRDAVPHGRVSYEFIASC